MHHFLICTVIYALISTISAATTQDIAICGLIAGLKNINSIGFAGWTCTGGVAINLCSYMWTGVSCNLHAQVKSIDLSGYALTGTISPALGNLPALTSLKLNQNQLSGPIPANLKTLTALKTLELQSNSLTGTIPASLCSIPQLSTLEVCDTTGISASGCQNITGCAPICLYSTVVIADYGLIPECTVQPTFRPTTRPTSTPSARPSLLPSAAPTTGILTLNQ